MAMGMRGLPTYAPFDRVLITAAAPDFPPRLLEQLKPGGMMVLPLGMGEVQRMMRITKMENGALREEVFDNFSLCSYAWRARTIKGDDNLNLSATKETAPTNQGCSFVQPSMLNIVDMISSSARYFHLPLCSSASYLSQI